jgi:hypothetical protein
MTILDVSIFMNEIAQVVSIGIFIVCQGDAWVDIVGYLKGGQLFSSFTKISYKFHVFWALAWLTCMPNVGAWKMMPKSVNNKMPS